MNHGNKILKRALEGDSTPAAIGGGVVKRHLVDARAEARRLLSEAQSEAERLHREALDGAQGIRDAAYREGYENSLADLNQHLLEARERRDKALIEVERDVLRLAVRLTEKIIGREIARDEGAIADIVGTALRQARRDEALTVRVNPADLPATQTHRDRIDPTGRARFLDFVTDPQVKRGGCLIESESGTIDAQLDTQLRALERALLEIQ